VRPCTRHSLRPPIDEGKDFRLELAAQCVARSRRRVFSVKTARLSPYPLAGNGGFERQRETRVREAAEAHPSSVADFVRATFSRKGRREEEHNDDTLKRNGYACW